ncbi:hypothetical protein V5O48_012696, partial [Marasmius crinis-equi]
DRCPYQVASFPKCQLLVAIFPTKGLKIEIEMIFRKLGLSSLAINEDTLATTPHLWKKAASPALRVLVLSPEQLATKQFDHLLQNKAVHSHMVGTAVDELHLILDWGSPAFRQSSRKIGNTHIRIPDSAIILGASATLPAGHETERIVEILGLKPGQFFFMRHSNIRPDVQYIQRILRHGLGGWTFPDLRWVVEGKRKTIIYCNTISLAFRVFVDLWYHIPEAASRQSRLRMYCSLFSRDFNEKTCSLFINNPELQIIISTDALKAGNDFPNAANVIILNATNVNDILQKLGHAGRRYGLVCNPGPRGFVYVTKTAIERAQNIVSGKPPRLKKPGQKSNSEDLMPKELAKFLMASCHIEELNQQYDNPTTDPPCRCETCSGRPQPPASSLPPTSHEPTHDGYIPQHEALTKKMKELGEEKLHSFREELWFKASFTQSALHFMSPAALLPDKTIEVLLRNFAHLKDEDALQKYVEHHQQLSSHSAVLWEEIQALQTQFRQIRLGFSDDEGPPETQ